MRTRQHPADRPAPGFRADIEGLRAVAVTAVVLFHAGVPGMTGGFIGVDVFFVISGFLITGMLTREATHTGTVRLARFYAARARRLLPAACAVLVVTAVASALLLPPLQARSVLGDAIASALYVGNYRFAVQGNDYLAADYPPSPFQHYWSLGVEEQFYLLWPALIIGTGWWIRVRSSRPERASTAPPYLIALALVALTSFVISLDLTRALPSWAFFSLPSRAWELAVGGLIALSAPVWGRLPRTTSVVAGWGGLTVILIACTQLGGETPYPGTAALLPALGTALVIGAGCTPTGAGVSRALAVPPMRAVGRVSYSWYLWHWPALLLPSLVVGHPLGLFGKLVSAASAAALAVLTLRYVENPGRFATALKESAGRSLALGAAATATAISAALVLLTSVRAPVGHGEEASALRVQVSSPPTSAAPGAPLDSLLQQLAGQVERAVYASADQREIPSNLSPSLSEAPSDKPSVFLNGCVRSWREVGQPECRSGVADATTTVALVGDSHAAMWHPALTVVAEQRHWRLETLAKVTCPLQDLPITSPYLGRPFTECEQWRNEVLSRLEAEHPQLIVLSMSRRYGADFGFTSYDPAWIDSLGRLVSRLRRTGAAVLVLGPVPDPHSNVPTCLSDNLENAVACAQPRSAAVNQGGIAAERAVTNASGGQYADLTDLFCTAEECPVIVGNTLVFRDDNHVTIEYAQALEPILAVFADRALKR